MQGAAARGVLTARELLSRTTSVQPGPTGGRRGAAPQGEAPPGWAATQSRLLVLQTVFSPEQCERPSPRHAHGGWREGAGLVADAVQSDLRGRLLRLRRGHPRRGGALHPRVVDDVLEGRPVSRSQTQTPFDEVLAFWRSRGGSVVLVHSAGDADVPAG